MNGQGLSVKNRSCPKWTQTLPNKLIDKKLHRRSCTEIDEEPFFRKVWNRYPHKSLIVSRVQIAQFPTPLFWPVCFLYLIYSLSLFVQQIMKTKGNYLLVVHRNSVNRFYLYFCFIRFNNYSLVCDRTFFTFCFIVCLSFHAQIIRVGCHGLFANGKENIKCLKR